jgi:hypothetical protein
LFENGWIHLTALEGTAAYAFRGGSHWHFNREDRDEVRTEEFGARLAEEIVSDAN